MRRKLTSAIIRGSGGVGAFPAANLPASFKFNISTPFPEKARHFLIYMPFSESFTRHTGYLCYYFLIYYSPGIAVWIVGPYLCIPVPSLFLCSREVAFSPADINQESLKKRDPRTMPTDGNELLCRLSINRCGCVEKPQTARSNILFNYTYYTSFFRTSVGVFQILILRFSLENDVGPVS